MIDVAGGWALDVKRGPGWLFVKLNSAPDALWNAPALADSIWALMQQHFIYRVVLDCSEIDRLSSPLLTQMVLLRHRIEEHSGMMRVCGLSSDNQEMIEGCGVEEHFPPYADCTQAVMASRPPQPR